MGHSTLTKRHQWCTLVGAFLLMFPIGLPFYWGNMSTYTLSFFLIRLRSPTGIQTHSVISLFMCCQAIGLFLVGLLAKSIGKRLALLLGIVIFLSGIFGTYFALYVSKFMMSVTLGVICGLGCGFVNGMALEYAMPWAGKHIGLVTAFILSGSNVGPLFINMYFSMYTNPNDESPDYKLGPLSYFTQDILDNVPSSYLWFGCLCAGILTLGFFMVSEFRTENCGSGSVSRPRQDTTDIVEDRGDGMVSDVDDQSIPPEHLFKSLSFYILWITCLLYTASLITVLTYYKSLGLIWIQNDHFLAWVGTAFTISTVVFGPIWGRITDCIGVKISMTLMHALSAVFILLLYFTPTLSKWLYLVAMILYGSSSRSICSAIMAATCTLFGKAHHSSNFGLVNSSDLLLAFLAPPAMEWILLNFGWFYLLFVAVLACFVGAVLLVVALPTI